MQKIKFFVFGLLLLATQTLAQYSVYYQSIDQNATGEALKDQLSVLITQTHTQQLRYTPDVWDALKYADLDPLKEDFVMLIYGYEDNDGVVHTDRTRHVDSSCHVSGCNGLWVREHVYPRSLGTPNLGTTGAGADVHALRAIDNHRNNIRGNRAFGEGTGFSKVNPDGSFYPGDEWKGDVARMMMYMHLRYPDQCPASRVGTGTFLYSDFDELPDIFLVWNAEDPPSEYEITRNNHFEEIQGNRNPFIDNPHLATRIWNGPMALDTWSTTSVTTQGAYKFFTVYPSLAQEELFIQSNIDSPLAYTIFTINGQIVQTGTTQSEKIDISSLAKGLYFLSIAKNESMQFAKFIKQ
jgi:endonuclease I